MYLDASQSLKGYVIVINPNVHSKAKLTREKFIERTSCVKEIRTAINSLYLTFYITSLDDYANLRRFYDLVNKGVFEQDNRVTFLVAIQPGLYHWFKNTDYQTIERQITFWLASLYFFNPAKRAVMEKQLYKPLLEEIGNLIDVFYGDFPLFELNAAHEDAFEDNSKSLFNEEEKCKQKYLQASRAFYHIDPPEFLQSPFDYNRSDGWGLNEDFGFDIIEGYFLEKDWEFIIEKGGRDDLFRSESRRDLWEKWKHTYTRFDETKSFVYSFYFPSDEGNAANKKSKREIISGSVKDKVWKRDEGKCTECGSKEKLEFDHIIPVVKGGASTYRNIQLLCEPCNRKKHSKIGS